MSQNPTSESAERLINKDNNKTLPSETKPSPASSQKTTGASPQMQLLTLAKHFALDGGLVAIEKQMPLEERTVRRERLNLLRKQKNLETIIEKTLNYTSNDEIANKADHDWFTTFSQLAEDIGNKVMQELWAKILAGEISQPGSFSVKTLKVFRQMSINEAKLLAKACSLAVSDQSKKNIRIISGAYQVPSVFNFLNKKREQNIQLSAFHFTYADLMTLADNHLLFIQETESNPLDTAESLHFNYNGKPTVISAKKKKSILKFYKFTPIGTELARLIKDDPDADYLACLKSELSENFDIQG